MIDVDLKRRLDRAISDSGSLETPLGILRDFKMKGGKQKDALDTLEDMRIETTEEQEDKILDVMDYVSGYCSPQAKIW